MSAAAVLACARGSSGAAAEVGSTAEQAASVRAHGMSTQPSVRPRSPRAVLSPASSADAVRAQWRTSIRHRPAGEQVAFLSRPEAIAALGARNCRDLIRRIQEPIRRITGALVTSSWVEHWERTAELPPGLGIVGKGVVLAWSEAHRHGVRLQLSRGSTRVGEDGHPSRRFTPPQAVEVEDMLDAMTPMEAIRYEHPESPSAAVIRRIRELRAEEV